MNSWYEVESLFFGGDWENDFRIDDQPARFMTLEQARAFLEEHKRDELEAYNLGELEELTEAHDYRIVKITREAV